MHHVLSQAHRTHALQVVDSYKQILSLLRSKQDVEAWNGHKNNNTLNDLHCKDEKTHPASNFTSQAGLILLDVNGDASVTSYRQQNSNSIEGYLKREGDSA